jgi:hypothetical protein
VSYRIGAFLYVEAWDFSGAWSLVLVAFTKTIGAQTLANLLLPLCAFEERSCCEKSGWEFYRFFHVGIALAELLLSGDQGTSDDQKQGE